MRILHVRETFTASFRQHAPPGSRDHPKVSRAVNELKTAAALPEPARDYKANLPPNVGCYARLIVGTKLELLFTVPGRLPPSEDDRPEDQEPEHVYLRGVRPLAPGPDDDEPAAIAA